MTLFVDPIAGAATTTVIGNQTPADAVANPTDAVDSRDFNMVWNGATWDRWRENPGAGSAAFPIAGVPAVFIGIQDGTSTLRPLASAGWAGGDASALGNGILVGPHVWNGTNWDRTIEAPIGSGTVVSRTGLPIVALAISDGSGGSNYRPVADIQLLGDTDTGRAAVATGALAFNGTNFDRTRTASATNQTLTPVKGVQLVTGPGGFAITNQPAVNTQATITQAAGAAGVRHVCTSISAAITAGATAGGAVFVNLRDGASGAGTILWSQVLDAPANGSDNVNITGLTIVGSAATAMTLEFSAAGGLTTNETVSLTGYDVI